MPLSAHERTILAGIEDELTRDDPELYDLLRRSPTAPAAGPRFPLSAAGLGLLGVVLVVLVLVAPLAAAWGAAGLGLLTVALVVPWMLVAARAGARRTPAPEPDPDRVVDVPATTADSVTGQRRTADVSGIGRRAVLLVAAVWALVLVLVVASHVGLANAVLITVALAMLVGVHVLRWTARRALIRRYGTAGWDTRSDGTYRQD